MHETRAELSVLALHSQVGLKCSSCRHAGIDAAEMFDLSQFLISLEKA